jgi:hypothetical protein
MLKRHLLKVLVELLDGLQITRPADPHLSAAQLKTLKRAAKIQRELAVLKKKLAQVLEMPNQPSYCKPGFAVALSSLSSNLADF